MIEKITERIISVPDVKEAIVLISENRVFIGVNLAKDVSPEKTAIIEREIRYRTRMISDDLAKIYITSQSDLVLHLKEITEKIKKGKKVSDFSLELTVLSQMME